MPPRCVRAERVARGVRRPHQAARIREETQTVTPVRYRPTRYSLQIDTLITVETVWRRQKSDAAGRAESVWGCLSSLQLTFLLKKERPLHETPLRILRRMRGASERWHARFEAAPRRHRSQREEREQDVGLLMAVGLRFFLACLLAVVGLPLAQCTDPRSDAGCKFSWRALGCTPAAECKLQFKPWWGTLGPCKKRPAKSEAPKAEAPKKAPAAAAATPKKAAPAEPVKAAEPAAAEPEAKEAPAEEPAAVEEPKEEV